MLGLETGIRKDLDVSVKCEWNSVCESEDACKCTREKEQAKHSTVGRVCVYDTSYTCMSHSSDRMRTNILIPLINTGMGLMQTKEIGFQIGQQMNQALCCIHKACLK